MVLPPEENFIPSVPWEDDDTVPEWEDDDASEYEEQQFEDEVRIAVEMEEAIRDAVAVVAFSTIVIAKDVGERIAKIWKAVRYEEALHNLKQRTTLTRTFTKALKKPVSNSIHPKNRILERTPRLGKCLGKQPQPIATTS